MASRTKKAARGLTEADVRLIVVTDLKASAPNASKEKAAKLLSTLVASQPQQAVNGEDDKVGVVVRTGAISPLVAITSSGTDGGQTHAASTLAGIAAADAGNRQLIVQAGALQPLVAMMRLGSQQAQAAAAAAVLSLSHSPDHHAPILKAGAVTPLVKILKAGISEAKLNAALALASLSAGSNRGHAADAAGDGSGIEAQAAIAAAGAIPILLAMLPNGKAQMAAASALAELSRSRDARHMICREGGIPLLLALLNGLNVGAQVQAAAAVGNICADSEATQTAVAKAGGLQPLLAILIQEGGVRSPAAQAQASRAMAKLATCHRGNQDSLARMGAITPLMGLLTRSNPIDVQAMAAMAVCEVCRTNHENQSAVGEAGGIPLLVSLIRTATLDDAARSEVAQALWVLADDHEANKVSIASSGALSALVGMVSEGSPRAQRLAAGALQSLGAKNAANQAEITSLLVGLLSSGSADVQTRAASSLWHLVKDNAHAQANIASAGATSDLIRLLGSQSESAREFALWALSHAIDESAQAIVIEEGGVGLLVATLHSPLAEAREQAATALARLAIGNATAQQRVASEGGIPPLIDICDASRGDSVAARHQAAHTLASLALLAVNRDTIVDSRGVAPLVGLLNDGDGMAKRFAAAALGNLALGGNEKGYPETIAKEGAITPLVTLVGGEYGEEAQQEGAGALFALADHAANRIAISEAGGIGPLVLLLGSTNGTSRKHAEGALVRLSIENANRELIIKKLVSMLYDQGNGGEEQAAAALANLASDSSDNRASIVEAGGIEPLLALLESTSFKAKERALGAISQLAHNQRIQAAIAAAGGIPLLANALASTGNAKESKGFEQLFSLSAFAVAQMANGNRKNQLGLAEAGAIQPLVSMLGSPNPEMQANAAGALAALARDNSETQSAIARTGAIAPLCALTREGGAPRVKEQSALAIWALSSENMANKATIAKLGGVEPLLGLLVHGDTDESLSSSVGAMGSLASKHADNRETIAKLVVVRLSSRIAMAGKGAVRVLLCISKLCNSDASLQVAIAKAGAIPHLVAWLSGSAFASNAERADRDVQREAAHALLSVAANNAVNQAAIAKADGIAPLIELVSSGRSETQEYAARTLWHLAGTHEAIAAIAEVGGLTPIVAMLSINQQKTKLHGSGGGGNGAEGSRVQELAAVVISRLTRSHAIEIAAAGAVKPLVGLLTQGSRAAQQHAASALADIAAHPPCRDEVAGEAYGVESLIKLLTSPIPGTPEAAAKVLSHLARDHAVCSEDGGALNDAKGCADASESDARARGSARRQRILAVGGVDKLIDMLWSVPNQSMMKQRWAMVAKVIGVECHNDGDATSQVVGDEETHPLGEHDEHEARALGAREQAAAALSDLAYGDASLQGAIIGAGGVPPLLRLIRVGSPVAQELAARAVWHLCAETDSQGALVECGAVSELVALSRTGSALAQELAAAVISDLARGAVLVREHAIAHSPQKRSATACPPSSLVLKLGGATLGWTSEMALQLETADDAATGAKWPRQDTSDHPTATKMVASEAVEQAPAPRASPNQFTSPSNAPARRGLRMSSIADVARMATAARKLGEYSPSERLDEQELPSDRLAAIAAAGGIGPLVSLVSGGSSIGKERAASALWHLSVDEHNQVAIAKAGGIAPLVALLDEGTLQGTVFAADALANLACDNPDNQAQVAKKLVGVVDTSVSPAAQCRAAHALWELAIKNDGAPVRIVNAGAISPLVALLGNGTIEAKAEAVGVLKTLAFNDSTSQLAIATGLVALLGSGSAEAQEHVTQMLETLAESAENRAAITEAGAIVRLVSQLRGGGETSVCAQALAASVLQRLAADSMQNVDEIVHEGGLKTLVALLSFDSSEAQARAAAVLAVLARRSVQVQLRIAHDDAIEPLVQLLDGNHCVAARAEAAGALWATAKDNIETQGLIFRAKALPALVTLLAVEDRHACVQAAGAIATLAIGNAEVQQGILAAGGAAALVMLLGEQHADDVRGHAATALAELVRGHQAIQTAVASADGIAPLVTLLRGDAAETAKEKAAAAIWALATCHTDIQVAVAREGGLTPLVDLAGGGSESAQAQAAGALAALAFDNASNQQSISRMLVTYLGDGRTVAAKSTRAARAVGRLGRADTSNQAALAAAGSIAPLVDMLAIESHTAPVSGVLPPSASLPPGARPAQNTPPSESERQTAIVSEEADTTAEVMQTEAAYALWSLADSNSLNQEAIAVAGGVPLLISLLGGSGCETLQRNAAGALWSLGAAPSNQRLIAQCDGIPPLARMLVDGSDGTREMAAGALNSLSELQANRVPVSEAGGIQALVALFEVGTVNAKAEAAKALIKLVMGSTVNQSAVAHALVALLSGRSIFCTLVKPVPQPVIGCTTPPVSSRTAGRKAPLQSSTPEAQEHATQLLHSLSLDADNRSSLAKVGAVPVLARQLRDGTAASRTAAAAALGQIALKSAQHRVQVTTHLVELLCSTTPEVRQRAADALFGLGDNVGAESEMTVVMAGGIDRFVVLLTEGSLEAQEYALWVLRSCKDPVSQAAIATEECAKAIIAVFLSNQLGEQGQEHAAAVVASLASVNEGVAEDVRAANVSMIRSSRGIRPLVKLLQQGSDGAKRHAASALTNLSLNGKAESWSAQMQNDMIRCGASSVFISWLCDPTLGKPEDAAQALSHIARHNPDAQATIASEGAIPALISMLADGLPAELIACRQSWAAAALAALAEDNAYNQIAIAEEGGIVPLVLVLRSPTTTPHESATRALWYLASDRDNQLAIARSGGLSCLVLMLNARHEQTQEWAAAALATLSHECLENQLALPKEQAIAPLAQLLGTDSEDTQDYAQLALLNIASASDGNRAAVIKPLVALTAPEVRNTTSQMKAAETLAVLAARSASNRTAIACAGAIPPLTRLLGDGLNAHKAQVRAAAVLGDLARSAEHKQPMISAGSVGPLVRMLGSAVVEAQSRASFALAHLASTASGQSLITEAGGLTLLVSLLASERLAAANNAACALWHLTNTQANKQLIVKSGGISKLISLLERTDSPEARESVAAILSELSKANKHAIVAARGIPPLIDLLRAHHTPSAQKHAACTIWGITTSEPTHQSAVSQAGAVPLLVTLLEGSTEVQGFAAAALNNLAQDDDALQTIASVGGVAPLTEISKGPQAWLRSQAAEILQRLNVQVPSVSPTRRLHLALAPRNRPDGPARPTTASSSGGALGAPQAMAPIFSPIARKPRRPMGKPASDAQLKRAEGAAVSTPARERGPAVGQQPHSKNSPAVGIGAKDGGEPMKALGQAALLSTALAAYEAAKQSPSKSARGGDGKKKAGKKPPTAPSRMTVDKAEPPFDEPRQTGQGSARAGTASQAVFDRGSSAQGSLLASVIASNQPSASNSRATSMAPSRSSSPRDKRASSPRGRRASSPRKPSPRTPSPHAGKASEGAVSSPRGVKVRRGVKL